MRSCRVDTILLPLPHELPAEPCVAAGEKISRAIEVMVSHNLDRIAVVRNRRAIGMIRLQDAFHEVGLEMPGR